MVSVRVRIWEGVLAWDASRGITRFNPCTRCRARSSCSGLTPNCLRRLEEVLRASGFSAEEAPKFA